MKQFEDKVLGYLDGSLDDSSRSELLHVLSVSPEKRALLDEHIRLQDALKAAHRPMSIPASTERRLAEQIPFLAALNSGTASVASSSAVTGRWALISTAMIAALAVLFSGILFMSPKNTTKSIGEMSRAASASTSHIESGDVATSTASTLSTQHDQQTTSSANSSLNLPENSARVSLSSRNNERGAPSKFSKTRNSESQNIDQKNTTINSAKGVKFDNLASDRRSHEDGALSTAQNQDLVSSREELHPIADLSPAIAELKNLGDQQRNITLAEIALSTPEDDRWEVAAHYRSLRVFSPVLGESNYAALGTGFFPGLRVRYNLTNQFAFIGEAGLSRLPQFSRTITLQPDPIQPNLTRQVYASGLIERTGVQVLGGASVRMFSLGASRFFMEFSGGASILGSTISPLLSSALTARMPLTSNLMFGASIFGESNWVRPSIADPSGNASPNSVGIVRDHYQPRTIWAPGIGAKISISFHP